MLENLYLEAKIETALPKAVAVEPSAATPFPLRKTYDGAMVIAGR